MRSSLLARLARSPFRPGLRPERPADVHAAAPRPADHRPPPPDARPRVLVAMTRPSAAAAAERLLTEAGYAVRVVDDGVEVVRAALRRPFAALVLNVSLPRLGGLRACAAVRRRGGTVPVLLLSPSATADERVRGLRAGAEDYLAEPFDPAEFVARVGVLARRPAAPPPGPAAVLVGDTRVDLQHSVVQRRGRPVPLTAKEYELLRQLALRLGELVSSEELLRTVWGGVPAEPGRPRSLRHATLRVHLATLRKKLGDVGPVHHYVVCERGRGYRLVGRPARER